MEGLILEKDIPFQVGHLVQCIYCTNSLPAKSQEHTFNSCWAGKHTTGQIICDQCNGAFSAIDHVFAPYTRFIMNAWQFKGERHKEVPVIETESNYTIEKGAKPKRKSEVSMELQEDGKLRIRANVSSKSEARRLILDQKPMIEEKIGRILTDDEIKNILTQIRNINFVQEEVGTLNVDVNLRIHDEYRSAAHTLIKCMALFDPKTSISDHLSAVRDFARYDIGDLNDFAIDAKPVISLPQISSLEVRYNSSEIYYSRLLGKIIGVVSILGRVKRWVVLSNEYSGPDQILFVMERIHNGGKLDTIRFRLEPHLPSIPLLETNFKTPSDEHFGQELAAIAQDSVSLDAPYNDFGIRIDKLNKKTTHLTKNYLDELTDVLLDYLKTLSSAVDNVFDREEKRIQIWQLGFEEVLTQWNLASLDHPQVKEKIASTINAIMEYITEQK